MQPTKSLHRLWTRITLNTRETVSMEEETYRSIKKVTLGEFWGKRGVYFIQKKSGEKATFSFESVMVRLQSGHISGGKPHAIHYVPYRPDARPLEQAQEFPLEDLIKVATREDGYRIPPKVEIRTSAANLLPESTPIIMMRAVLTNTPAAGIFHRQNPRVKSDEEPEGLACEVFVQYANIAILSCKSLGEEG